MDQQDPPPKKRRLSPFERGRHLEQARNKNQRLEDFENKNLARKQRSLDQAGNIIEW